MKILLVGDIMLGRLVNEALKRQSGKYPWGNTLPIFKNADLRISNLECVISDIGEPWPPEKVFHFRTDEKNIKTLLSADIGMVSLANNHILDYGYDAMRKAMDILGKNAISYAGVGLDNLEAREPAICDVDGKKVGLIAFTDNEPSWEAGDKTPGLFYVPVNIKDRRVKVLFETIKKTRDDVDILIISAHWGPNWGYEPPPEHIPFAHALVDAGADIIFGHSGHVFRGVEIYKDKAILYCTGNFIDDYAVDETERNDESFIFVVDIEKDVIKKLFLYPTVIRRFQARVAQGFEQEKIYSKMQELCEKFQTESDWNTRMGSLEIKVQ